MVLTETSQSELVRCGRGLDDGGCQLVQERSRLGSCLGRTFHVFDVFADGLILMVFGDTYIVLSLVIL